MTSRLSSAMLLTLVAGGTTMAFTPSPQCSSDKLKAAAKGVSREMDCHSKAKSKAPFILDPNCLARVDAKTAAAVNKAGNACAGTAAEIQAAINACVDTNGTLVNDAPGTGPCPSATARTIGKCSRRDIGCQAKEFTRLNTLPACRSSADASTSTALTAAGSCATGDTIADIHACTIALDVIVDPPVVCDCCSKTIMSFTSHLSSTAKTGELLDDSGAHVMDLTAGGLYFGGGLAGIPLPLTIPSSVNTQVAITACDPATGNITIGPRTAAQTGSNANCSATGCLFGPPMPFPNPQGTATSTCKVAVVSGWATGSGNCSGSISSLNLQLNAGIYLTGDLVPSVPGIQPCPICTDGTCKGGQNNGLACTPGTTTKDDAYPTSNDCPPDVSTLLGDEPVSVYGTTDTLTKTAVDNPATQPNVFCGFCGSAAGVFENPQHPCTTNATCTTGIFTKCRQRNAGAFATDLLLLNTARTITETGAAALCLADGAAHDATLVSMFCAPPAYNGIVDYSNDLPGPGAASARVTMQLLP